MATPNVPPIPDESQLPITSNAPMPPPTAPPPQQQQSPPVPMPILAQLIRGLVKPPMQTQTSPDQQVQFQRPTSRLDTFESFLGNFVTALGHGMAAAHGPGAFGKGFGAAVTAPYEQAQQQFQQSQAAQANQAQIQEQQARAQLSQAQAGMYTQTVMTPMGPMNAMLAKALFPSMIKAQTTEDVTGKKITSSEKVAGENIASREKVAGQASADRAAALKGRLDMARQSQEYQNYRAQLANTTKLKVAQLTAGKAPAAMMQTATFAQSGINRLDDAQAAFDDLTKRGVLGSVTSDKLENWIFGNGLIDPSLPAKDRQEIGTLRSALSYTSSAAMRAHTGKTSKEIYHDFQSTLGLNQGEDALRGAFDETRKMLGDYAMSASDTYIRALRSGQQGQQSQQVQPNGRRIIDLTK